MIKQEAGESCRYTYDEKNRVIREDNLLFGNTFTYKYDKYGKLIERNTYDFTLSALPEEHTTDVYVYSKKHKLLSYNGESCKYDRRGNPIIYRDATLKWKHKDLLSIDNIYTFEYDKHMRISKTVRTELVKFYSKNDKIYAQDNGDLLLFIYDGNEISGFSYYSGEIAKSFMYKKNENNDVVGIFDSGGELVCEYVYDVFGDHKTLVYNVEYSDVAYINPIRFRSKFYDIETGMYFIDGKYYDAQIANYLN
ncbi:MAG: hypothetical protein E7351_03595 [Clostridiales bacterium]|nr:hypothetical protein [Clostridiales bacterium]